MTPTHAFIDLVHSMPGRTRLRLSWLRAEPDQAPVVADGLQDLPGLVDLEVQWRTGSVLLRYDPTRLDVDAILARVRALTGVDVILRPGEESVLRHEAARAARREGTDLARAVARFFKEVDADILTATGGLFNLPGTVAAGFLVTATAEILTTGRLPLPSWHDLAWRAFRTFTTFENQSIAHTQHPLEADRPAAL